MNKPEKRDERVIIVDDYTPMRETLKRGLESMGFVKVVTSINGKDALKQLESREFDIIISDFNMPVMDGLELLKKVRENKELSHLPFIMLTAEADRGAVMDAVSAGVSSFILKPFSPFALEKKINKVLRDRNPEQALIDAEQLALKPTTNNTRKTLNADGFSEETILVVDDHPNNIDIIVNLLKPLYNVKAAKSGQQALKIASSKKPPDLILLDIMMPEMDGYEVCRKLKSQFQTEEIPVIFLSSKGEVTDITKGFNLGAADYVTKPIEPEILVARIKIHLAARRSKALLEHQIDTLVENSRLKEDIERMTLHDIKNPLSAITAQLALLENDPEIHQSQKPILGSLKESAKHALSIASMAHDIYKMETGTYDFHPQTVNIKDVAEQVIQDLNSLALAKSIQLQLKNYTKKDSILADESLCYTILSNLVKNAIEASAENDKATISIEEVDSELAIRITNDGVVPKSIREKLFDKYVTANKAKGTGLGTYSAKLMTLIQNGRIEFETINEKTTVFTIRFQQSVKL